MLAQCARTRYRSGMETETIRTAVAAAAVAGVALFASPAQAAPTQDTDHAACISWSEFTYAERGTMSAQEHAWEVVGLGRVVWARDHGRHVIKQYPRCNYPQTGQNRGWVQVAYDLNKDGHYMSSLISQWTLGPDAY